MAISSNAIAPSKQAWLEAVREDLEQVTARIKTASFLDNHLLDAAVNMILTAGGKRMRPATTLLVGQACGGPYEQTISVAASIELLHTATLVHDDVVDGANERRGAPTLHTSLPLGVTILTGDFLFAQAASLAADSESLRVMKIFSQTLVSICRGEILQSQSRYQVPNLVSYNERIYGKTAALYEASAISAAILAEPPESVIQAYATFGRELGMAFQVVDDALDFLSSSQKLGKPAGHDLREGHVTLPAMLYIETHGLDHNDFIRRINDKNHLEAIITAIREEGAAHQAIDVARQHIARAEAALESVQWSPAIDHLMELGRFVTDRDF